MCGTWQWWPAYECHVSRVLAYTRVFLRVAGLPPPASYKCGVSWVYGRPRPLSPAGGNTLDDITSPRPHWPPDVPHMPNRLAVKWRQPRPVPFTFNGLGGTERLSKPSASGMLSVDWLKKRRAWTSVAERKPRGCSTARQSYSSRKETTLTLVIRKHLFFIYTAFPCLIQFASRMFWNDKYDSREFIPGR